MAINQFGNFYFIAIHGTGDPGTPPQLCATQVEILQRPGHPGTAIIDLGKKGQPFQMRSIVDTATPADATLMAAAYKNAQGKGPFALIWAGVNFLAEFNTVYCPVEVNVTKCRRLLGGDGGLYPPSRGLVECIWTLVPIELPTP